MQGQHAWMKKSQPNETISWTKLLEQCDISLSTSRFLSVQFDQH